jgi:hypothetical protein
MSKQSRGAFLILMLAQVAHSIEESAYRLFDVFPPARFVSSLLSDDLPVGFALANAGVVAFGFWCYAARVRPSHASARAYAWFWAGVELINGIVHGAMALSSGGYFPGVATVPALVGASLYLVITLRTAGGPPAPRLSRSSTRDSHSAIEVN